MEGRLPTKPMPYIWGDFNALGWAGAGDESIYALDKEVLAAIPASEGMQAFIWTDDEEGTILGCIATLQQITLDAFCGWRAQPVSGTFYRGPKPALLSSGRA